MSVSFNKAIIAGNLARDPELKYTASGKAVVTITVAVNDYFSQSASFFRVIVWEKMAENVAKYLGRYYLIEGIVVKGKEIGKKIGFPTANIKSPNEVYPKDGVYAVKVGFKGEIFNGACSIGMNPTFDSRSLTVEVFILDVNIETNLYGEHLKIVFIERIRGVRKFDSINELIEQIKKDVIQTRNILNKVKISFREPEFI